MTASTTRDLLQSLLSSLRQDLKPELNSAQAKHRAELMDMMLVRLATEAECSPESNLPEYPDANSRDALTELRDGTLDDGKLAEIKKEIARFASAESERRAFVEQRLEENARLISSGEHSSDELSLPEETYQNYLRQKFPKDLSIRVVAAKVIPGGRSKGTIRLDVEDDTGERCIVIRRDFASSVTGVSVTYEYPIIKALFKAGVPVPEPLWLEDDPSHIGGAFIAFAEVRGKAMGALFQSDASPEFVKQFAAVLARVHAIDIDATGIGGQLKWGDEEHPVRAMLDSFYQRYTNEVPRTPILDAAFTWLYLQLDEIGNERGLVHGDANLHNAMGDEGEFTALLDWELCHAGDPAEDLGYCKQLVETILPWREFMEAYSQAGGKEISDSRVEFFCIWRSVMVAILMGSARSMYESGVDQDLRIAAIGFNSFPRMLNQLAAELTEFTS